MAGLGYARASARQAPAAPSAVATFFGVALRIGSRAGSKRPVAPAYLIAAKRTVSCVRAGPGAGAAARPVAAGRSPALRRAVVLHPWHGVSGKGLLRAEGVGDPDGYPDVGVAFEHADRGVAVVELCDPVGRGNDASRPFVLLLQFL